MNNDRHMDLLDAFFDDALSPHDAVALHQAIVARPELLAHIAERGRMEALLRHRFRTNLIGNLQWMIDHEQSESDLPWVASDLDLLQPSSDSEAELVDLRSDTAPKASSDRARDTQTRDRDQSWFALQGRCDVDLTPVRHIVIPRSLVYAMIAALIAVAVLLAWPMLASKSPHNAMPPAQPVATLTKASDAVWDEALVVPAVGDRLVPGTLSLLQGRVQVTFTNGAQAFFEGPAQIDLQQDDRMALIAGMGSFHVPPNAIGFEVLTDAVRIVDLGTDFAVVSARDGLSDVHVFSGKVRAALRTSNAPPLELTANFARRFDARNKTVEPVEVDPYHHVNSWDALHRRVRVQGDIDLFEGEIASLADKQFTTARPVLIRERENVQLPATTVAFTHAGTYEIFQERRVALAAGTRIDSYLVRWQRAGNLSKIDITRRQGTITFARPIVGVITNRDQLLRTDPTCGLPDVPYSSNPARGMDQEATTPDHMDTITISDDRRTLTFDMAILAVDEFRVFIEARNE